MVQYMHCPLRQYCQRYKSNLVGAFTSLCDLLSGITVSGSTRDCDRSTVGLEITSPVVVRVVSSELPDGGCGVRTEEEEDEEEETLFVNGIVTVGAV